MVLVGWSGTLISIRMEKKITVKNTDKKIAKKVTKRVSTKVAKNSVKKVTKKVVSKKASSPTEFAIIETGGKQYMVSVGDIVDVELLDSSLKEGDSVKFDKVLMVDNGKDTTIGMPYIDGAVVKAVFQEIKKGKKLHIVRYKAKSNRERRIGHRQKYSRVRIESLA